MDPSKRTPQSNVSNCSPLYITHSLKIECCQCLRAEITLSEFEMCIPDASVRNLLSLRSVLMSQKNAFVLNIQVKPFRGFPDDFDE